MSAPVDVLAVLDDCVSYLANRDDLAGYEQQQMADTRAAVAELIEASESLTAQCEEEFCSPLTEQPSEYMDGEGDGDSVYVEGGSITFGHIRRARAALARVGGVE